VLRSRRMQSRYIVVYEIINGRSQLRDIDLNDQGDLIHINLSLTERRNIAITLPGTIRDHSDLLWRVKT
jgi:hypothetical protein